jgi:hypothetical protein
METVALALEYIQNGLSIFPLKPRSKIPLLISWEPFQITHASNKLIEEWFSNGHAYNNIAIVTGKISRIFALDIDAKRQALVSIEQLNHLMTKDLKQHSNILFVSRQVVEIPIS